MFLQARKKIVLNVPSNVKLDVQDRFEKHIQTMVTKLGLPENAKNEAIEIAKKVSRSGALQGRRPHVIAAGIIDGILPGYGRFPTINEIAEAGDVAVKNLYSIRRALKVFLSGQ